VVLRPWNPSDVSGLTQAMQDPEIVRWLDVALPYTHSDASAFIEKAGLRWEDRSAAHFAVQRIDVFAGYLGVLATEAAMSAVELVYWTVSDHRRRGVATAAVAAGVEWVQHELSPSPIEIGMAAGNAGSLAVAQANGFEIVEVRPGAARRDGRSVDEIILRLSD
jgi:RimJ/RimL family protein N-acetyltransferase